MDRLGNSNLSVVGIQLVAPRTTSICYLPRGHRLDGEQDTAQNDLLHLTPWVVVRHICPIHRFNLEPYTVRQSG